MSAPILRNNWQAQLRDLPLDWSGDRDGARITELAIFCLESFAVVPCSDGGLQLEVHRDGFEIEICIGADGRIESALIAREPAK